MSMKAFNKAKTNLTSNFSNRQFVALTRFLHTNSMFTSVLVDFQRSALFLRPKSVFVDKQQLNILRKLKPLFASRF